MSLFTDSAQREMEFNVGATAPRSMLPVPGQSPHVNQELRVPKPAGFLLIGAPGSGKGTIGKTLHRVDGFIHVSTGDLVRQALTAKRVGPRQPGPPGGTAG